MYYIGHVDYSKLTAKDHRLQSALVTAFMLLITIGSFFLFKDELEVAGILGLLTLASGVGTAIFHHAVCREAASKTSTK